MFDSGGGPGGDYLEFRIWEEMCGIREDEGTEEAGEGEEEED